MSLWRQIRRGLRALANPSAADRDLTDEAQHFIDEATDAWAASGLTREEAVRAARLELGSAIRLREDVRASGWEHVIETSLADLRYAARRLRRSPGHTAVVVATLALGIGATTAIFSAVNPILFEPLPYPRPARITMIGYAAADGSQIPQTFGTYRELGERSHSFDAVAVEKPWQPTITGMNEPERLEGQRVSAAYFDVFGVAPAIGRDFDAAEDRLNGPRVAILSDALWRRRFGGDPAILGRQITLDDNLWTVIGVMPRGFENVLAPSTEIWAPLQYDMSLGAAWGHHLRMLGRLRLDVGVEAARTELDRIAHTPMPEFPRVPWASLKQGLILTPLQDYVTAAVKPALLAIFGAVLLVLATSSINVTNLLLARSAEQRAEFAMRVALGASAGRVIRQLLAENLLIAAIGGAVGLIVAAVGVRALIALSPPALPRVNAIAVDGSAFAFALGVTALVGLMVGLVPAFHASRQSLRTGIRHVCRGVGGTHHVTRHLLVAAEISLALVLLVTSGLLVRSLQGLFAIHPGFETSHVLTMQVQTSGRRFDKAATDRFFAAALERVRSLPGVTTAALTSQLPLSGDRDEYGAHFEQDNPEVASIGDPVFRYAVSPGYFETMGIPLRRGRFLDTRDDAEAPQVVLISDSLARRKFGNRDPLGQRVHIGPADRPSYTIVGVVGDIKQTSLALDQPDAVYITTRQSWFVDRALSLVVRLSADPGEVVPAIRRAIWSVDRDQPIARIALMDDLLARSAAGRRFALIVFETFALVALLLAATGIFGVLSSSVIERTHEFGVRAALGATRRDILLMVIRQALTLAGIAVIVGLVGAAAAARGVRTLLFRVSWLDPQTYLAVIGVLLAVAMLAAWLPAWRAVRVDPSTALRAE